jgi:crotonobetainyl-CoA:carnitine CoA-transferase CaiB-like acyl-CoA transferase
MTGPLEGIRVIDCSRGRAGARMTWLMAEYGADVIWVEPPGGDPWRDELAVPYSVYNRNKRSVELDLDDPAGLEALLDLLETADVFVETWRRGVAERLGLGFDAIHESMPSLVYCSISGYGPGSVYGDLPGYTALVHAGAGMAEAQFGHREGPIFLGLPQACNGAAYMALIGVLAALYRREDDGWGRRVETSLVDGVLAYMAQGWGYGDASAPPTVASFGSPRFVTRTFLCADDEWLGLSTFGRGAFDRLMKVLGLDDRVPPLDDANVMVQLSPEEAGIVFNEVPALFLSQPRGVWLERLLAADIAAIPALRPCEVFDEPQTVHNEMVTEVVDPVLGPLQQAALPIRFASTPGATRHSAPTAGQHTAEVLAELRNGNGARAVRQIGVSDERPLLDGVKVLDLGHWYAGPYSSRLLADLGADVIKLEPPVGDGMRGFDRAFAAAQAGKRAIAADLKDPELAKLRHELLQWADVIHHNLRVGVTERLGLGYEQVRAINPDIVYLAAPGWGSSGPEVLRQSFAPLMSGYVGAAYELGGLHNPPIYPTANEDSGAGMLGGVALIMALLCRKRTGAGQYVELPQLNSTISDVAHIVRRPDGSVLGGLGLDPLQLGPKPLERLYQTADGWVCLVAPKDDEVRGLGKVMNVDLLGDDRFRTPELRADDVHLERMVGDFLAAQETASVMADLRANGVPVVEPLVDANRTLMDDPENLRLGRVGQLDHPRFGRVREVAVPYRVSATDFPEHRRAPEFGEHTEQILLWAGYSEDEIAALRERRAIR